MITQSIAEAPQAGDRTSHPEAILVNTTLKSWAEVGAAITNLQQAGGPLHSVPQKNWDLGKMLSFAEKHGEPSWSILDVGCAACPILEGLYQRGFRTLHGIDLMYSRGERLRRTTLASLHRRNWMEVIFPHLRFYRGDFLRSGIPGGTYDLVTSLSVLEHVPRVEEFFREMARLLKPSGFLLISTDYWPEPIESPGQAYGAPIKIFSEASVAEMVKLAADCGFDLLGDLDLRGGERVVTWEKLEFTFLFLAFQKR
jgi:SAM-dependent methyltransferase